MARLLDGVRTRLIPALLTAAGVALVTAGLVTWTDPASAGVVPPDPQPSVSAPVSPPSSSPSGSSVPASPSTPASGEPSGPADRVATRVAIPALRIDLPVILPPGGAAAYPLCDVAMFIQQLGQPGGNRATYLYAHAREGMFLPLLRESEERDGAGMLGMIVQVWTSDEQLFLYEITQVRRHQTTLKDALAAEHDQLWLQTSEGPRGTVPKLQVVAEPLSNGPASDPADAHPAPKPVACE